MAACWRCGTKTPVDANFCPNCGAEARAQVRELDVFAEPADVTEPVEAATSSSPRGLIVGALAVLIGLTAFYALTGTDDEPTADPADSNSTDERAGFDSTDRSEDDNEGTASTDEAEGTSAETSLVGSIDWTSTFEGTGFPRTAIEIDGSIFLFVSDDAIGWLGEAARTRTYRRSADGQWRETEPIGGPTAAIAHITATEDGAVATGTDGDSTPTVWWTSDGTTWRAETLPPLDGSPAGMRPGRVVSASGTTMVLGTSPNTWAELYAAVSERFPDVGGSISPDWNGPGSAVTLRGPFGMVLGTITLEELGIDDVGPNLESPPRPTWVHDGVQWKPGETLESSAHLLALDGSIVRASYDDPPVEISIYADGWSQPIPAGQVWGIQAWGDRLIGLNESGDIALYGTDFTVESSLALPSRNSNGNVSGLSAGEAGLMVLESVWQPGTSEGPDSNERFVVLRDGYTLDVNISELRLSKGDDVIMGFWGGASDRFTVDLTTSAPAVTFLDEDGAPLVTFSVAELAELEAATLNTWFPDTENQQLWFTPDGLNWFGGSLGTQATGFLQPSAFENLLLTAVVDTPSQRWNPVLDDFQFRILEAPIPD